MDTFFARNRLSAYLDGSLEPNETAEVESALAEDASLREEYARMRRVVELLRSAGPLKAPAGLHARVMAQVRSEPPPGRVVSLWRRTVGRLPVEALALAAAALVVVVVIQGREPSSASDASRELPWVRDLPSVRNEAPELAQAPAPLPPPTPVGGNQPSGADGDLLTVPSASSGAPAGPGSSSVGSSTAMQKSVPASKKGSTPETPYYAGWEQGEASADATMGLGNTGTDEFNTGIALEGPRSYRISLADSEVLYRLSAVAEKTGGRLLDSSGKAMTVRSLGTDDAWVRVQLVVPRGNASAVEGHIGGLGGVPVPPPANTQLYGTDHTVFVIEVAARP